MQHEYAQRATDVLARRTRLSFLNVHSALLALPRVVDIMGEELHWSHARKRDEIRRAVAFFESMGLPRGSVTRMPAPIPRGLWEKAASCVWGAVTFPLTLVGAAESGIGAKTQPVYKRAKFEPGEMALLKSVFEASAGGADKEVKVQAGKLKEILKEVPGYEEITPGTYEYVLVEAGLKGREVDLHEFLEVRFFPLQCFSGRMLTTYL